jgi:hypothetical protein
MGTTTGNNKHAFVWSGSATNYVDLNQFLPAGFTTSVAEGIDGSGNIFGYASGPSQNTQAFLWKLSAAPEPSQTAALALGTLALTRLVLIARRRRATDA